MSSLEELQRQLQLSQKLTAELQQRCEKAEQGRNKLKQQLSAYHRVVQEAKWLPQKVQQLSTELQTTREELSKEKERSMNNSSSSEHRIHFDHQTFEQMRGKLDQTHQQLQQQKDANKGFQDKLVQIEDNVKCQIQNLTTTINKQQQALQNMQSQNEELVQSKQELQHNVIKQNAALISIKQAVKELFQFQGDWGSNVAQVQTSVKQVQQQLSRIDNSIAELSSQKQQMQQIYQPDVEVAAAIEDLQDQCQQFQNKLTEVGRIGNAASAFFTALYGTEPPHLAAYNGPTLSNSSLNAIENKNENNNRKQIKTQKNINKNNNNNNNNQIVCSERPTKRQKTIDLESVFQDVKNLRNEQQIKNKVGLIQQQCSNVEEIGNAFILSIKQCAYIGAVDITHVKQINWKLVEGQGQGQKRCAAILAQMPWCVYSVEQLLWLIKGWCLTGIDCCVIIRQLQEYILEGIHNFQQQQQKRLSELCVAAAALTIFGLMNRKKLKNMRIWMIDLLSLGNTQTTVPIISIVLAIRPNLLKPVKNLTQYSTNSSPQIVLSLIVQFKIFQQVQKCKKIVQYISTTQGSILKFCTNIISALGNKFWGWPSLGKDFNNLEQFIQNVSLSYISQKNNGEGINQVKGLCVRLVTCTQSLQWVCGNLVSELLMPQSSTQIFFLKQILRGAVLCQSDDRNEQNSQIAFVLQACRSMVNLLNKQTKMKTQFVKLVVEILLLVYNQCDRVKVTDLRQQCRSCLREVINCVGQLQENGS